jgi:hypothetical protein
MNLNISNTIWFHFLRLSSAGIQQGSSGINPGLPFPYYSIFSFRYQSQLTMDIAALIPRFQSRGIMHSAFFLRIQPFGLD